MQDTYLTFLDIRTENGHMKEKCDKSYKYIRYLYWYTFEMKRSCKIDYRKLRIITPKMLLSIFQIFYDSNGNKIPPC